MPISTGQRRKYLLSFLLVGLFTWNLTAQTIVTGKVLDAGTDEPVLFASIGIVGASRGTSTNEEGEFELKLDSLPSTLGFTHLNYETQRVQVSSAGFLTIKLEPSINTLDEVTVFGKKAPNQLVELVKKAFYKVKAGSKRQRYGKAFYRQKTRTEDEYYELYEIFYDTKYTNAGISDWAIQEGRYALKGGEDRTSAYQSYVFNRNFTLLNRVLTTIQPETEAYVMPVHQNVETLYDLQVARIYKSEGRTISNITFTAKQGNIIPGFSGQLYIDIDSHEILKITAEIKDNDLKLVKLSEEGTWDDYSLFYELAFKGDPGEELLLDYINVTQAFDYINSNQVKQRVETKALLSYYEYYSPVRSKKLGGKINRRKSDADLLDRVGYNQEFWADNPIVKRTPVEMEVISSFEEDNSFGTIYLNNKQLIEFEKDGFTTSPVSDTLLSKFDRAKYTLRQQKVYLHTDKPYYLPGETIWFKAYLVDALEHNLQPLPTVLYVELVNSQSQIAFRRQIFIENGSGPGEIQLPDTLQPGNYLLRAYTNWMRNFDERFFYHKSLAIYDTSGGTDNTRTTSQNIDLQFFPEGGMFVQNVATRVGFKAVDAQGKGVPAQARIVDDQGQPVAQLQSNALGMGSFFMRPQAGKSYFAEISSESAPQRFALPQVDQQGFGISVRHINSEVIKIVVQTTPENEGKEFYLLGQIRGIIYYKAVGKITRGSAVLEVPKSKFQTGILQLTLFDDEGQPQCERLMFTNDQRAAGLELDFDRRRYRPREQAKVALKLTDAEGKPLIGDLSVSITDASQVSRGIYRENIKTYFLLNSDLGGQIENPGYYFQNQSKPVLVALDDLMLTQGWRRFSWGAIVNEIGPDISFKREGGIRVSGVAKQDNGKVIGDQEIYMVSLDQNGALYTSRTDASGRFIFDDLLLADSSYVSFNMLSNGKKAVPRVTLDNPDYSQIQSAPGFSELPSDVINRYVEYARNRQAVLDDYLETKILDEVVITESSIETEQRFHTNPDVVIKPDLQNRSYNNVYEMLNGRVPGMTINGNSISMRGGGSPLFVIDGLVINEAISVSLVQTDSLNTNIQTIDENQNPVGYLNPRNIDRIEVLRNAEASMYGIRGGNGVIAIYTKGYTGTIETTFEQLQVNGLQQPRAFYEPKYLTDDLDSPRPDQRATLYWQPKLITNHRGAASMQFFNSDQATNFEVVVEGVTSTGQPVFLQQQLQNK